MSKSTDEKVTQDLIETLEDSKKGFTSAAEKATDMGNASLASKFSEIAKQRAGFSAELEQMAAAYGDDIDESGSVAGTLHRGWMALKDALSGSDPEGILDVAEQGEDHAVSEFEKALKEDISADLQRVVTRMFESVKSTHAEIKALRNAAS